MMEEEKVQAAMSIILYAGEARTACKEMLDAISVMEFDKAKIKLDEAQKKITEAHRIQTDAIQDEARGEKKEYSLLFAHAQDTLMTVYSEINIGKQLLKIFRNYSQFFVLNKSGEEEKDGQDTKEFSA